MANNAYISCCDLIRLPEVPGPMNNWKRTSGEMSIHVVKDENLVQELCQMHVFSTCSQHLNKKYWTPNVCKVAWGPRGHQKECYVISTLTSALKPAPKCQVMEIKTQRGEEENHVLQEKQNIKRRLWRWPRSTRGENMISFFQRKLPINREFLLEHENLVTVPWTKTVPVTWQGSQTCLKVCFHLHLEYGIFQFIPIISFI